MFMYFMLPAHLLFIPTYCKSMRCPNLNTCHILDALEFKRIGFFILASLYMVSSVTSSLLPKL